MQACEVWLSVPPKVKMETAAFPLSLADVVFRHSVGCVSPPTGGAPHAVDRLLGHSLGLFDSGVVGAQDK